MLGHSTWIVVHPTTCISAVPLLENRYPYKPVKPSEPGNLCFYHFGFRAIFLRLYVSRPFSPRTLCSSSNFLFAYLRASESSTSSSTMPRFRSAWVRLSVLGVPKGVLVGMIVPSCTVCKSIGKKKKRFNYSRHCMRTAICLGIFLTSIVASFL